ncbi:MAG TPA: VOC family protein [Gemmatimonadota bacterium]|nr:VOC family protein [Gemmatimonadota bacterium]
MSSSSRSPARGASDSPRVLGIHHVTAISTAPQRNLDFYVRVLGLRLVKRTVNFDDPTTYHLYFGDETGRPGSLLTFFPWPGARRGRQGVGQLAVTSFAAAPSALAFWTQRLVRFGVDFEGPVPGGVRGDRRLSFRDPDGLMLAIVADPAAEDLPVRSGADGIEPEHALRGFHTVEIWEESGDETGRLLVDTLGFHEVEDAGFTRYYEAGDGGPGRRVAVRGVGQFLPGMGGAGTVHHVAWRASGDEAQLALRRRILEAGLEATEVIDRRYFHSVYFREPGGVLFEIATDPPGFTLDEPLEELGEGLMLPPWLEGRRAEIEAALPEIHLPARSARGSPPERRRETPREPEPGRAQAADLGFVHRYVPPPDADGPAGGTTLLLLHGTGGDENDLVALGRALLPGAALLSPRGNVLERGMPRFFRRLEEGVFDQEDLSRRTLEMSVFLDRASEAYGFDPGGVVAVGFSNGANMAASLLLRRPELLRGAVLLSPMVPFIPSEPPDLGGLPVFIGAGRADPVATADETERLVGVLEASGAAVTLHWEPGGHGITDGELDAARRWIAARGAAADPDDRPRVDLERGPPAAGRAPSA